MKDLRVENALHTHNARCTGLAVESEAMAGDTVDYASKAVPASKCYNFNHCKQEHSRCKLLGRVVALEDLSYRRDGGLVPSKNEYMHSVEADII